MTQTALILGGTGKIGSHAAEAFDRAGWNLRQFNRKTDDMISAARDVDVIINGLNPPNYANWAKTIPAITKQVIAAAKASGAMVIIPGNIYNFGDQPGELNETTPHLAHTRKGKIRIDMEAAYRQSGVQTIILRAGNFIDPRQNGDIMSHFIMRAAKSGKIIHGGDPDCRNAYAYVPDWARAAVMLAEKRQELARFVDIPFPGHSFSIAEFAAHVAARTGQDFKCDAFPWWLMTLAAPVWELARELREMRYLYGMDHWIGSEKFARILPDFQATPLAQVMDAGIPKDLPTETGTALGHEKIVT